MKQKTFFIISLKQTKQIFLDGESPTLIIKEILLSSRMDFLTLKTSKTAYHQLY